MTEPLKPCPCGSKAELHEDIAMSGKGQFWVQSEAGWVGPTKCEPDDAVDAWNTRLDAYLASPGNTDPMTIAKYDDELRKASPSREAIALKLQEAFALKRNGGALPMLDALAMADAILSLSPASPAPVWRSMDSAPKDGTEVIGYVGPAYEGGSLILSYYKWNGSPEWRDWDQDVWKPTHWMPLPASPGTQPTEQPPQASALLYDHIPKQDAKLPPQADVQGIAKEILEQIFSTYRARNGRDVGIEDDNGEKVWLLPDDGYHRLRALAGEE